MADGQLILPPDSTGQILDVEELTVGVDTVIRERVRIAGVAATELAPVSATQGLMVQFGPTDNAVLDAIAASVAAIDTDTSTIAGNQLPDGHSVALSATDNAVLDAIAASVAAIDTDATTIIGHVDGIEGLLTTIDADTGALVAGQLPDGHAVTVDNAAGAAAVNIQDGGNSITVDGSLTVDLGANNDVTVTSGTIDVIGTVADDATTPGDPVMVGGQAVSPDGTDPTAVAENDVVRFRTDLNRRLYVATNHPRTWHYHLNTSSAQTDTSVQAAPGAGLRLVITNIQFTSGAATAINMFLEEGASTIWGPIYLEAVAGRGYVSGPIFKPVTANTALTLTTSAAIAHAVEILGFIEAV